MPTSIEPVKELTDLCHSFGSRVLIDGAHAPGQIVVDVPEVGCDYYMGNCHKWLFCPKGTAFLVVQEAVQDTPVPVQPTVISSTGRQDYLGRFLYTGTRDYTAFSTISAGMSFYESLGPERVLRYCTDLVRCGAQLCADAWGTRLLCPTDMCAFMVNVELPCTDRDAAYDLQRSLDREHNVYMVYESVPNSALAQEQGQGQGQGQEGQSDRIFFVRLSAQVYLDISDFETLARLVQLLLKK